MSERSLTPHIGPVWFDGTVHIMVLLTCLIVFFLTYFFTKDLKLKPTGKQNAVEWIIDFSRGIVTDNLPRKELSNFHSLAFTLSLFVFIVNNIGLVAKIVLSNETTLQKSPTVDPFVALTLIFITILLTHLFGMKKLDFKGYFINPFLKPYSFVLPMKLTGEFTNLLTLALRLYGNTYAGEVLSILTAKIMTSLGWFSLLLAIPLEMVWIAFSLFIGSIQAFAFVTLSTVYMNHEIEVEEQYSVKKQTTIYLSWEGDDYGLYHNSNRNHGGSNRSRLW